PNLLPLTGVVGGRWRFRRCRGAPAPPTTKRCGASFGGSWHHTSSSCALSVRAPVARPRRALAGPRSPWGTSELAHGDTPDDTPQHVGVMSVEYQGLRGRTSRRVPGTTVGAWRSLTH